MPKTTKVCVSRMDGKQELFIQPNIKGKELMQEVTKAIGLREIWYFGLQFTNSKGVLKWLHLEKKVMAQHVGKERPLEFTLRVRFYPEDAEKELTQEITRKLFFLQVKEDIQAGNILCPAETNSLLISCAEQYEEHYREEAVIEYLKIAQTLEMFSITYFEVKNKKGTNQWLGVHALGINIYTKENRQNPESRFPWSDIHNLSYTSEKLIIKFVGKKFPDLVFSVLKKNDCKSVLELSMGNHALHLQRTRSNSREAQRP